LTVDPCSVRRYRSAATEAFLMWIQRNGDESWRAELE
jgi:hypothetical protein